MKSVWRQRLSHWRAEQEGSFQSTVRTFPGVRAAGGSAQLDFGRTCRHQPAPQALTLCKQQLPQPQGAGGSPLCCNIISVTFVTCCPHPPGYGAVPLHTIPALNMYSRLQDFNRYEQKKPPKKTPIHLDSPGLEFHTCSWQKPMFNGVHLISLRNTLELGIQLMISPITSLTSQQNHQGHRRAVCSVLREMAGIGGVELSSGAVRH